MKKFDLCQMAKSEMNKTKAGFIIKMNWDIGESCGCGCFWADNGGSSEDANFRANYDSGYWSKVPN